MRVRYIIEGLLLLILWLLMWLPGGGEWYAGNLYPVIARFLSGLSGCFPFSLSDCFIYGSIAGLLLYAVVRIVRRKPLVKTGLNLLEYLVCTYLFFYFAWGLNYSRDGFYEVVYPDGRRGYLPKADAMPGRQWRAGLKQGAEDIIATAHTLMGVPYLWAGTSSKGMDCSGFVRTVLFMHDIIIPRDASQQAYVGEHIDIAPDFGNLQPGDLIFFGRKATAQSKERVVHVGISLGGKRFIHSQGDVHISSFDPADELFDSYNLGRLLFAVRVLPYINEEPELNTTATNPFYAE